jgi:hypothetical protein
MSSASNLRLFRIQDFRIQPCKFWDEQSLNGTYDWTDFDALIESIHEIGAEPLICIGRTYGDSCKIPPGMDTNPLTGLPYPSSFAAYASDLVQHLKEKKWSVRYWEIWNEPANYMFERDEEGKRIWGVFNETRVKYFMELFSATSTSMQNIDPEILIGTDASLYKGFFDYMVSQAKGVGFLSFHKYDAWGTWLYNPEGYLSDGEILKRAGRIGNRKVYSPKEARVIWREMKGVDIPVICSETNLNLCWINGTDPRIQQIIGAVWYAEALRTYILNDVIYSVYFTFASDNRDSATGGAGFGMVNKTRPYNGWYPYWISYLLGNNLKLGDIIYESSSSNLTVISALSWQHDNHLNVLLNHKVKDRLTTAQIRVSGLVANPGRKTNFHVIDGSKCEIRSESTIWSEASTITLDGYCVVLLSVSLSQ